MSSVVSSLLLDIQANVSSLKQSLNEGKSQLFDFKESALKIGEAMGIAFGAEKLLELGKQFGEFALKVGETKEQVEALNINGNVEKATASVLALSSTFGTDLKETLNAVNTQSQAFGTTFDQSSKLVEDGMALATGKANEFLAITKEFSRSFASAGVSADQFSAIAVQALNKGFGEEAFAGLQKGIKQIELMSPIAQKALNAVGLSATGIEKAIQSGSLTPLQVLQQMGEKLKDLPPTSEKAAEAMNLFGKSSSQLAGFLQFLSTAKNDMKDLVDGATDGQKAMIKLSDASTELNGVWVQLFGESAGYWTALKANLVEGLVTGLKAIINGVVTAYNNFADLYNSSLIFRSAIEALIFTFKQLWDAIKGIANIVGDVFSEAGRIIHDVFTLQVNDIPKAMAKAFSDIAKDSVQWGKNLYNDFYDGVKNAVTAKPLSHILGIDELKDTGSTGKAVSGGGEGSDLHAKEEKESTSGGIGGFASSTKNFIADKLAKDFKNLKTTIDGAVQSAGYMPDALQKIGDSFNKHISETAYPAAEKLGSALATSAADGKASLQALGNQAANTAKSILGAALAASLAESIQSAASIPFPLDLIAIAASTAFIGAAFAAIPSFATGTQNFDGGWAKINEGGVGNGEAVFLPSGSQVIPARESGKIFGGSNTNVPKVQVSVVGKISGRDILLSQNETNRVINNSR